MQTELATETGLDVALDALVDLANGKTVVRETEGLDRVGPGGHVNVAEQRARRCDVVLSNGQLSILRLLYLAAV